MMPVCIFSQYGVNGQCKSCEHFVSLYGIVITYRGILFDVLQSKTSETVMTNYIWNWNKWGLGPGDIFRVRILSGDKCPFLPR
jgi:hypothetical protein